MRPIEAIGKLILGFLALGVVTSAREGKEDDSVPSPDAMEDSPAEQSAWLDQSLPKLLEAMRASKEVRAKITGPLVVEKAPPFPLTAVAMGLAPGDLNRWSALTAVAVAANPRYGHDDKIEPRPTVTVMPNTQIVRVGATYPAPAASKDLEPGPLTIDVWVCPDRPTAIALFWLRNGTQTLDMRSPETIQQSVVDTRSHAPHLEAKENPPGERAFWNYPRFVISVILPKGHKPMPADRLCFLRGNTIVEASTVEYTRKRPDDKWGAWPLSRCASDVVAVMRSIDAGLLRLDRP